MYTIISGTSRQGSNSKKIALQYQQFLAEKNINANLISLDETPVFERTNAFIKMEEDILKKSNKFIVVLPEYNGTFPGIFKLMLDNTEVAKVWPGKKILLVGVATGRAGNLRGLEHITGAFMHVKSIVHNNRLPISAVHTLLNEAGELVHDGTVSSVKSQIEEFIEF